jgi:hypothetical protein
MRVPQARQFFSIFLSAHPAGSLPAAPHAGAAKQSKPGLKPRQTWPLGAGWPSRVAVEGIGCGIVMRPTIYYRESTCCQF